MFKKKRKEPTKEELDNLTMELLNKKANLQEKAEKIVEKNNNHKKGFFSRK